MIAPRLAPAVGARVTVSIGATTLRGTLVQVRGGRCVVRLDTGTSYLGPLAGVVATVATDQDQINTAGPDTPSSERSTPAGGAA